MKRRSFIQSISAAAGTLPLMLSGLPVNAIDKSPLVQLLGAAGEGCEDHVLVLIQLNGGNDGLNTVTPIDQIDNLQSARSNIFIPENRLLKLNGYDNNKIHPAMTGFQTLFNDGKMNIIQNVGYPNQDFSHFRSTDIWLTASDADVTLSSGWLGRYLDTDHPNFPADYPNQDFPDPLAIQVGYIASPAFHGPNGNFAHTINNVDAFYDLLEDSNTADTSTPYGHELAYIRRTARQTNAYNIQIKAAAESATNLSNLYPPEDENPLADQLKIVARLIGGGLQSRMYMVSLTGFDTHASQVDPGQPTEQGAHAELLGQVSEAVLAFQDDIEKMSVSERVLTMTFSEFGRRIASNGSYGTDHGAAAPLFMIGNGVEPGMIGNNPVIPTSVSESDNLPMEIDFRSVYGSVLRDWFCVDDGTINDVLFGDFPKLKLTPTSIHENDIQLEQLSLYPNPAANKINVKLISKNRQSLNVEVYNSIGVRVLKEEAQSITAGENEFKLNIRSLNAGVYYLRMYNKNGAMMKNFVKQ